MLCVSMAVMKMSSKLNPNSPFRVVVGINCSSFEFTSLGIVVVYKKRRKVTFDTAGDPTVGFHSFVCMPEKKS